MNMERREDSSDTDLQRIRVGIVEDHASLRGVLVKLVRFSPNMDCYGGFASGEQLLQALKQDSLSPEQLLPNVVSLDLTMPRMSGIEVLGYLRQHWPEIRCVLLSGHTDVSYVRDALEQGAYGYVAKGGAEEFLKAINQVALGRRYVSPCFDKLL
ncbi:response regulator transcription factor [Coraliomargarita sp. SDUM461004]|uniref:Response regulator transcription factor n=1 Tax=Thalassobacterium sedimentorum TaxID=3041258 RepID=A0ABU1AJ94_9BACT|nr:response regulator transcription factor [Coraliomargarita sp. SDUM461004]MDQ8194891.1 response regulator transcription factor [Coraliomargarita sp. SDUM461004]